MSVSIAPSLTQRIYSWTDFKALVDARSLGVQYAQDANYYKIWAYDGPEAHICTIWKVAMPDGILSGRTQQQNDSDLADFEANYKPSANQSAQEVFVSSKLAVGDDATQKPVIVGGVDRGNAVRYLNVDSDGNIAVVATNKLKLFTSFDLVASNTPARVRTSGSGSYSVGGTTLTISVNGVSQQYAFATRAAAYGMSVSAAQPGTSTANCGSAYKMKVSVDGGSAKEISIANNLKTGAAIAAAVQTAIRASVANGSNVTVDYNSTNYGKYTIKSGASGASSSVVVSNNAGQDASLAKLLKLGVANGGTETVGLAGNLYTNQEVATLLDSNLDDLSGEVDSDGKVLLTTIAKGAGATIQVSSGGANPALGFPTTQVSGTGGSGYTQLNVNGATTNVSFEVPATPGKIFVITDLYFRIRDGAGTLGKFGGLTELTNGIQVAFRTEMEPLRTLFTAVTNAELLSLASTGDLFVDAYSNGDELVIARFSLGNGIPIRPGSSDGIFVTVRDNLTGLTSFTVQARGYLENI